MFASRTSEKNRLYRMKTRWRNHLCPRKPFFAGSESGGISSESEMLAVPPLMIERLLLTTGLSTLSPFSRSWQCSLEDMTSETEPELTAIGEGLVTLADLRSIFLSTLPLGVNGISGTYTSLSGTE